MTVLLEQETSQKFPYLVNAFKIRGAYESDDFMPQVIEGRQRLGKSSYSMKCAAQAHGEWSSSSSGSNVVCDSEDYDAVKKWVVFQPSEFMNLVLNLTEKVILVIWDDAGYNGLCSIDDIGYTLIANGCSALIGTPHS
jgi:hypothetical protein